ncbi:MAG TPA: GNAT family N-acetyltransferase [Thermoanaerobaculia bacterium]|nr:GNAT family N-acetyltransferase [Thermoanaerobaculia bacterium]
MNRPTLRTERLTLRPFTPDDTPAVQRLVSAYEVAANTLSIPHPYPEGAAAEWIAKHDQDFEQNRIIHFAIDDGQQLVGAMGLVMKGDGIAEIGYWIGVPFWGRGYATEAARAVVQYGFEERGLERIFAMHFGRNPQSGNVLRKSGMQYEGTLRRHLKKWEEYVDLVCYGVLREEWANAAARTAR